MKQQTDSTKQPLQGVDIINVARMIFIILLLITLVTFYYYKISHNNIRETEVHLLKAAAYKAHRVARDAINELERRHEVLTRFRDTLRNDNYATLGTTNLIFDGYLIEVTASKSPKGGLEIEYRILDHIQ